MNTEARLGTDKEIQKRSEPDCVYYFGGALNRTRDLIPVQTALEHHFSKSRVIVKNSQLSLDWPQECSGRIAEDIQDRLNKGDRIGLILHSLGAVEASIVLSKIDDKILHDHAKQLRINLVSPAGLFTDRRGMLTFLSRFFNQTLPREFLLPGLNRGLESLVISTQMPKFVLSELEQLLQRSDIFKDYEPLFLNDESRRQMDYFDDKIGEAVVGKDRQSAEQLLRKRGHSFARHYGEWLRGKGIKSPSGKLTLSSAISVLRILNGLASGKTWRVMQQLKMNGADIRLIRPVLDPIVTKDIICRFFQVEDSEDAWKQLIASGQVVEILGAHATHVFHPKYLINTLN